MRRTRILMAGKNNRISCEAGILINSRVIIEGDDNQVSFGPDARLLGSTVWIQGNGCRITFGRRTVFNHCDIAAEGTASAIRMADTVEGGGFMWVGGAPNESKLTRIYALEGRAVSVGTGTVISDDVTIRNSDSHPIQTADGRLLNPAADVTIGEMCWICAGATILKGSVIANGSVVGAMSLVNSDFGAHSNALLAGNPAKVRREGILWKREKEPK